VERAKDYSYAALTYVIPCVLRCDVPLRLFSPLHVGYLMVFPPCAIEVSTLHEFSYPTLQLIELCVTVTLLFSLPISVPLSFPPTFSLLTA
jgi:hypothetical protein